MPGDIKSPSRISGKFLGNPISKGAVDQLLALIESAITTAIQHYGLEDLGAGEGIEPASSAPGRRTGVSRVTWPKKDLASN
jgi:hypothetical protein